MKLTLSDGQSLVGGVLSCDTVRIPTDLKQIIVAFRECERSILYLKFIAGDNTVTQVGKEYEPIKAGRLESFDLEPGEQLLGCHLHTGYGFTYGVTWIKWRPPQA